MRTAFRLSLSTLLLTATFAVAQDNPYSTFNKGAYARLKSIMVASAEKMPEES